MKRFIVKLCIFGVIIYSLAWGLDYIISSGLLHMEDYRFMSWNDMKRGQANADIVIMGNSRGFSHFEPWTIDSICGLRTYCLGLGGYSITVETMKYHYYRLHNQKPKYIIQQVDYYTMRDDSAPHQHESEQFLPLIYDRNMHQELRRVGYSWKDVHLPLFRYFGYQMVIKNGIFEYLGIKHYVHDPSRMGHHYETGTWNGGELAKMDTIIATMNPSAQLCFEEYMRQCQEEGIKVILVNSPTYYEANRKTKGLDAVNAYFEDVAQRFGSVYWNYNENYDLCNDTTNFCVSVHMNPEATHRFTTDLANRIANSPFFE